MASFQRARILTVITFVFVFFVMHMHGSSDSDTKQPLSVIFENQSGRPVELWSDTPDAVDFKAALENEARVRLDIFVGDRMYFAPTNSGGSHERQYYMLYMTPSHAQEPVTLYDKETMRTLQNTQNVGCDGIKCVILFVNKAGESVRLYWDDGGKGQLQGTLRRKQEQVLHTYVGHTFFATRATSGDNGDNRKIYSYTVTADSKHAEIVNSHL